MPNHRASEIDACCSPSSIPVVGNENGAEAGPAEALSMFAEAGYAL
jgi:hypothetical protein